MLLWYEFFIRSLHDSYALSTHVSSIFSAINLVWIKIRRFYDGYDIWGKMNHIWGAIVQAPLKVLMANESVLFINVIKRDRVVLRPPH